MDEKQQIISDVKQIADKCTFVVPMAKIKNFNIYFIHVFFVHTLTSRAKMTFDLLNRRYNISIFICNLLLIHNTMSYDFF